MYTQNPTKLPEAFSMQTYIQNKKTNEVKRVLRYLTEASLGSILLKNLHRVTLLPESSLAVKQMLSACRWQKPDG